MKVLNSAAVAGAGLTLIFTLAISCADAITKFIAAGYAAPQLFCLSGAIVVALSWAFGGKGQGGGALTTVCPRAMALRSVLTVVGSVAFFYAFRMLPFAEVFVFIGLMPLFAGALSGMILSEHVRPVAWTALLAGGVGVLCLFPIGWSSISVGHVAALSASLIGTLSLILARYIGRYERNALAQVFYPNLALFAVMGLALPFVYQPMSIGDFGWVVAYGLFLFAARWLLVVALRLLAAYAVTPLLNFQFVWMVVLGAVFFGEYPAANIYLGVAIIIGAGIYLVYDQMVPHVAPAARSPWLRFVKPAAGKR